MESWDEINCPWVFNGFYDPSQRRNNMLKSRQVTALGKRIRAQKPGKSHIWWHQNRFLSCFFSAVWFGFYHILPLFYLFLYCSILVWGPAISDVNIDWSEAIRFVRVSPPREPRAASIARRLPCFPQIQLLPGWWYTHPSEKYDFVSWDDDIPIYSGKIKFMFQSTNEYSNGFQRTDQSPFSLVDPGAWWLQYGEQYLPILVQWHPLSHGNDSQWTGQHSPFQEVCHISIFLGLL